MGYLADSVVAKKLPLNHLADPAVACLFFFPPSSASPKPNLVVSTQTQNKKGISL
jgi:hypothetical protein